MNYNDFLKKKQKKVVQSGFEIDEDKLNDMLFNFQKFTVKRALKAGKYAIFADTGQGKTPMQLDTIERVILLYSNKGETVFSPFGGIGSEGYQAIKMGRKSISIELKESYFSLNVRNHNAASEEKSQLSLF